MHWCIEKHFNKPGMGGAAMSKKGIELSLNTMIIAILVLVAAAVIIAIFIGGMKGTGEWFKGASSCTAQGGECVSSASECAGQAIPRKNCDGKGEGFCCIKANEAR